MAEKGNSNPYLAKPARRQVPKNGGPIRAEFSHHSSDYNIWYHKKLGDRFDKEDRIKSATRCSVAADSGYTKADRGNRESYICIFYARGHCANGAECKYYHRPPTEEDEARLDVTHDVFGRERHRTYRDDMGGVGSFSRENKTLHVSGLKRSSNLDEVIMQHFAEWGQIDTVKVIWDKAIAFVKFRLRASAEFAKEAMQDQALNGDEVLVMRWANEDPNPVSKEEEERKNLERLAAAVQKKKVEEEPTYTYTDGSAAAFPSEEHPNQYPDTDQQFQVDPQLEFISSWLDSVGLKKLVNAFMNQGLASVEALSQLDDFAMDSMGIADNDQRAKLMYLASHAQKYMSGEVSYTNEQYEDPNQYYQDQTSDQASHQTSAPTSSLVDYGSDDE